MCGGEAWRRNEKKEKNLGNRIGYEEQKHLSRIQLAHVDIAYKRCADEQGKTTH